MQLTILISFFLSILIANNSYCDLPESINPEIQNPNRIYYNIGDTISDEDQDYPYDVCYSDGNYGVDSSFRLSDYSGKITLISMNATW